MCCCFGVTIYDCVTDKENKVQVIIKISQFVIRNYFPPESQTLFDL